MDVLRTSTPTNTFSHANDVRLRRHLSIAAGLCKAHVSAHRGCVPCDHGAGETIEFTEIIDAIRSGTIDGNEIMLRPGFRNEEEGRSSSRKIYKVES